MQHLHGTYNTSLVLLSYLIAVISSYAWLDLAGIVSASKSGRSRMIWLVGGAISMGIGIWSMHFVSLLAFNLSVPVFYNIIWVLVSVAVAFITSYSVLYIVGSNRFKVERMITGGLLMGAGIVAVHYTGMASINVSIHYDVGWSAVSVLVAVIGSIVALWLASYYRGARTWASLGYKIGSGIVMGAVIAGMHYAGMAAASFEYTASLVQSSGLQISRELLGYIIVASTLVALTIALLGVSFDKRLISKDDVIFENGKWYKSLYENHTDGMLTTDIAGLIVDANPAFQTMTGRDAGDFIGRSLLELTAVFAEDKREQGRSWLINAMRDANVNRLETELVHTSGTVAFASAMSVPVTIDEEIRGTYLIFRDITEEKRSKEQIRHLAYHDELTRLPNRRMINQQLDQLLSHSVSSGSRFAVMVLDIDRFKLINDLFGHSYGDQFLRQVTERLQEAATGFEALIGRMGGDEFAVICEGDPIEVASVLLAQRIIEAVQVPFRLKDSDFYVSASIGIALYPEHGESGSSLLKNADFAMYDIKHKGKNGFRFYSGQLDDHLLSKVEMENALRKAIERNELVIHYQPQLNARQERVIGIEALIRWIHPERGLVPPSEFIPIAEESGIIGDIGAWVLRESCRQLKWWQQQYGWRIPVSVNLSPQQFLDDRLIGVIEEVLRETGLAPEFLELEITESVMMDATRSSDILMKLTEMGIRFSLDDFGTGYSSLSYLRMFPIERLKIDRSFIKEITESEDDRAIVETIISMAHHLKMNVIAEGVETMEQLRLLRDNGCDEIQGFYYSRPLPPGELERFIAELRSTHA